RGRVHGPRRVPRERRDGGRVRAISLEARLRKGVLPRDQQGGARAPLRARVPLHRLQRGRPLERRSAAPQGFSSAPSVTTGSGLTRARARIQSIWTSLVERKLRTITE